MRAILHSRSRQDAPVHWTYKGINIYPAAVNSSGIRWYATTEEGDVLRADTKESMRELIKGRK